MPPRERPDARAVVRAELTHGWAELVGDPDRPLAWTLLLDGTAQSHVDLADPTHLEFEYVRRLGHLVDAAAPAHAPLRVLHLGGGAWTLPRYVSATRPGSRQRVVELDGGLVELVRDRLPADEAGLDVVVSDARAALTRLAPGSVDLLVLDVFSGTRTPAHLTSAEFVALTATALAPDGVYAANVADGGRLTFARTQVAAAAAEFAEVAVLVAPSVLHGRRFGNLVLIARGPGRAPLPLAALTRASAGDPFPARVLHGAELAAFHAGAVVPDDRSAGPSPRPPPGTWGRPG